MFLLLMRSRSGVAQLLTRLRQGRENYYSNMVLVIQHKIGHGLWSEVKAAET